MKARSRFSVRKGRGERIAILRLEFQHLSVNAGRFVTLVEGLAMLAPVGFTGSVEAGRSSPTE